MDNIFLLLVKFLNNGMAFCCISEQQFFSFFPYDSATFKHWIAKNTGKKEVKKKTTTNLQGTNKKFREFEYQPWYECRGCNG